MTQEIKEKLKKLVDSNGIIASDIADYIMQLEEDITMFQFFEAQSKEQIAELQKINGLLYEQIKDKIKLIDSLRHCSNCSNNKAHKYFCTCDKESECKNLNRAFWKSKTGA